MDPFRFNSGAVFEVTLPQSFGYAYVKIIHFKPDNVVIQPLERFSKESFSGDFEELFSNNYTSAPYLLLGGINIRGKNKWKYLGDLPLLSNDLNPPEFKRCFKFYNTFETTNPELLEWHVVKNIDPVNYSPAKFQDIKQLGMYMHCSIGFIRNCLWILWSLRKELQVPENDIVKDSLQDVFWRQAVSCTKMVV